MRFPENIAQFKTEHPNVTRDVYGDHGERHAGLNFPDIYVDEKKNTNKSVESIPEENMMQILFKDLSSAPGVSKMKQAIKDMKVPEIKVLAAKMEMGGSRLPLSDETSTSSLRTSSILATPGVDLGALQLPGPMDAAATHVLAQHRFCSGSVAYCSLYL